jgi:hypothetical protein
VKYALVIVLTLIGCQVNHASEQFACDETRPCSSGRVCDNGFCVVAGAIDAAGPMSDAPRRDAGGNNNNCPPGCTSCNVGEKTCTISCADGADCAAQVICPAGYKCSILCNTDNSCREGVNCKVGASCTIECSGKASCQGVECGAGACDVSCSGVQSCKGVACGNSCACDVACTGSQACEGIACTSFACRSTNAKGCTSEPVLCNSCQ